MNGELTQALTDQLPFAIALFKGPQFVIESCNRAYKEILGCGDFEGKRFADAFPEFKNQAFRYILASVFRTGKPFVAKDFRASIVNSATGKEEERFWDFSYTRICDRNGHPYGIYFFGSDVTEKVLASRQLEIERKKLEVMIVESPAAMALFRGPTFIFELVNQKWEELVGPREYIGKTYSEAYPELAETALPHILKQVFETGVTFTANEMLVPVTTALGNIENQYYDFSYIRIENGEAEPYGIFCHAADLTGKVLSRKVLEESQASLRLSEERLSAAIEVSRVGFYDWDILSNKIVFSLQMQKDWGIEAGVTLEEVLLRVDSRDREIVQKLINEAIESQKPYRAEYRVIHSNGDTVWIESRGKTVYDDHAKPITFFGTSINITDRVLGRQQLESAMVGAERASQTKSAFLANMSHEIRTPLGAILGFTDLLKTARLTGEEREYLDIISRSGAALSHIIDDILDLSKVEAGQLKIESVPFELKNLAKDVVTLFSDSARSKELSLKFESDLSSSHLILSDPTRVRQILVNLIGNAIKFTDQGYVTVSLSGSGVNEASGCFQIRVSDTGKGISEEQARNLFQPFVQADESTTRNYGGTGLGLALSRRLANALNGNVEIEASEVGCGTTFLFSFRSKMAPKSEHEEIQISKHRVSEKPGVLAKCLILVVDDSPDNRVLMNILLRRAGATVDQASSGEEAIEKAFNRNYDIVLMDIQMPVMDGYDALAELKRGHYEKPVIALTAHAMVEEKRRTFAAGFVDHVTKPVDPEILMTAILNHI